MKSACAECGAVRDERDRFCGGCGAPGEAPGLEDTLDPADVRSAEEQTQTVIRARTPQPYEVGAIVNDHRFNGVEWVPLDPTPEVAGPTESVNPPAAPASAPSADHLAFEVGAIVNGHRFNGTEWVPATPPPPTLSIAAPPPPAAASPALPSPGVLWRRSGKWIVAGLVAGALVIGGTVVYDQLQFHLETDEGEVEDAAAALADVEGLWRDGLPSDHITLSDDAGCWFELDDAGLYVGRIACGGARLAGSAPGHVWWEVLAEATEDGGSVQIDPDGVEMAAAQAMRPDAARLVDASGDGPAETVDDVDAPPLPAAEPGLVLHDYYLGDTEELESRSPGETGDVYLPSGIVHVERVTELPSAVLTDDSESAEYSDDVWGHLDLLRAPAEGETFSLVEWTFTAYSDADGDPRWYWQGTDGVSTTATVSHEGAPVADFATLTEDGVAGGTTLVSAPTGALLHLDTAGVVETIDLATGRASTHPGSTPYRSAWFQSPGETLTQESPEASTAVPGEGTSRWQAERELTIDAAALTPYLPPSWSRGGKGWADEGKTWLVVSVSVYDSTVTDLSGPSLSATTTAVTDSWRVVVDGEPYQARAHTPEAWDEYRVAVQVPVGTTSATVELDTAEAFELTDYLDLETSQTVTYPAVSYDLDFTVTP